MLFQEITTDGFYIVNLSSSMMIYFKNIRLLQLDTGLEIID